LLAERDSRGDCEQDRSDQECATHDVDLRSMSWIRWTPAVAG
jgi:hypothetical protein